MVFGHLPSNVLLAAVPFAPSLPRAIMLLPARACLSQMDVPTRQAYVMALVPAEERTAAAAVTNTAHYVTRPLIPDDALHHAQPTLRHTLKVLAIGLAAWGLPLAAVVTLTGTDSVFTAQGLFFTGTALVTFGGAYAVLAFVAQRAVETYAWLSESELRDLSWRSPHR
jgi:hypothetical protein